MIDIMCNFCAKRTLVHLLLHSFILIWQGIWGPSAHCNIESYGETMKATVFLVLSLAFVFGRVMAAPLDEDQTSLAEDENQVNSLDSNEYSQQLYEKVSSEFMVFLLYFHFWKWSFQPTHLDDPGAIKRFLRSLMSSVSDPPLLKAKLIVVARSKARPTSTAFPLSSYSD